MTDLEALERSKAGSAQIRSDDQATRQKRTTVILLVIVTLAVAYATSPRRSGSEISDTRYKAAAEQLIKQRLRDPASAEFSALEVHRVPGRATVVCGLVNSRNGFGGMSGPQRFIAGDQVLVGEDIPAAYMAEEWNRQC